MANKITAATFIPYGDKSAAAFTFSDIILFPFSFPLAMGHATFTTLADWAVHVLRELQHFNQICKLFHGKCIVVNAKVGEEQTGFLFFGAILLYGLFQNNCDHYGLNTKPCEADNLLHYEVFLH